MTKLFKVFEFLLVFTICFSAFSSACRAEVEELKKGVARGTFMVQGYSFWVAEV